MLLLCCWTWFEWDVRGCCSCLTSCVRVATKTAVGVCLFFFPTERKNGIARGCLLEWGNAKCGGGEGSVGAVTSCVLKLLSTTGGQVAVAVGRCVGRGLCAFFSFLFGFFSSSFPNDVFLSPSFPFEALLNFNNKQPQQNKELEESHSQYISFITLVVDLFTVVQL